MIVGMVAGRRRYLSLSLSLGCRMRVSPAGGAMRSLGYGTVTGSLRGLAADLRGHGVLEAMIAGQRDPQAPAQLAHGRMHGKMLDRPALASHASAPSAQCRQAHPRSPARAAHQPESHLVMTSGRARFPRAIAVVPVSERPQRPAPSFVT